MIKIKIPDIEFKLVDGCSKVKLATSTIRIPKAMSSILDSYKALAHPNLDKERVVLNLLNSHPQLVEFRNRLASLRFK